MAFSTSAGVKHPRYRRGKDNSWMAPMAARHPNATRTIVIVCVVCGVGVFLALLGVAGYRRWAASKSKRESIAAAAEKDDSVMLQENRLAEQAQMVFDNSRPSMLSNNLAGSKSRKQAASVASREP